MNVRWYVLCSHSCSYSRVITMGFVVDLIAEEQNRALHYHLISTHAALLNPPLVHCEASSSLSSYHHHRHIRGSPTH